MPVERKPARHPSGKYHAHLNSDMPDRVVSDRANVSPKVIEQHYDRRIEREKMEQRRDFLDDL